ncbi:MAG: hypothetical protein IPK27_20755 [Rhodanobacteraceae bacterium]|nr:hypothetical protein [Rhodanobacteraceae bacterium]
MGLTDLVVVSTGGFTVNVSVAGSRLLPALLLVSTVEVLLYTPADSVVTSTDKVHDPAAGMVALPPVWPSSSMPTSPGASAPLPEPRNVPPHVFVLASGLASVLPAGKMSSKASLGRLTATALGCSG